MKSNSTLSKIICNVNCKYGVHMGRKNVGKKPTNKKIHDCYVPMDISDSAYDKGGAYWGLDNNRMRVSYTKDLSYIKFYRENESSSS